MLLETEQPVDVPAEATPPKYARAPVAELDGAALLAVLNHDEVPALPKAGEETAAPPDPTNPHTVAPGVTERLSVSAKHAPGPPATPATLDASSPLPPPPQFLVVT